MSKQTRPAQRRTLAAVSPPPPSGKFERLIPILLILAVILVFGRSATFEFTQWDNYWTPGSDPNFSPPNWEALSALWARPHVGLYVPVTYSLWWVLAKIGYVANADELGSHLNPWVYHCANLVVHLLSAAVVYALARRLIGKKWPACAAALLFALHPVQVESVVWVDGMRDALSGLLALVALWQYVLYASATGGAGEPIPGKLRGANPARRSAAAAHYALATAAFVAGMFAKPSDVVVPLLAAILDLGVLRRPPVRVLRSLWLWVALAVPVVITARIVQTVSGMPVTPLALRPLIAGDALAFYLGKIVWPAHLAPDYGQSPLEVLRHHAVYFIWLIPAALGVMLLCLRRRIPWAPVAAALMVVPLLPVLGFTPFEFQYYSTVSDHYLYLAMLGPAMALGWAVASLAQRVPAKLLVPAIATLLLALGLRSALQTGYWRDDMSLWRHTLEVNPHSFAAYDSLGIDFERADDVPNARKMLEAALREDPRYSDALDALIFLDLNVGDRDQALAMGLRLIESNEGTLHTHQMMYLGTYRRLGKLALELGDAARATAFFSEVHRLDPNAPAGVLGLQAAKNLASHPPTGRRETPTTSERQKEIR